MAKEYKLPDLGEGVETGDVVSVLVSQGDAIQVDQGVIELETDKALIEVPSESAGTVASVNVSVGDSIPPGTVLITVEETVHRHPGCENIRCDPGCSAVKKFRRQVEPISGCGSSAAGAHSCD